MPGLTERPTYRQVVDYITACPDDLLIALQGEVAGAIADRNEVDPAPPDRDAEATWDPWRALRQHPEVRLLWANVAPSNRGRIEWDRSAAKTATIYLDHNLSAREARKVLTHELTHHERALDAGDIAYLRVDCDQEARDVEEVVVRAVTRERMDRYRRSTWHNREADTPHYRAFGGSA